MPTPDTATYKPVCCYQCGETYRVYTMKDVWDMRIDGVKHKVPILGVPVMRCDACNLAVIDGSSDDAIVWSYNRYLNEHGLNTPWLKFRRFVRRQILRVYDRWNYWVFKTFYKKKEQHGAAS